MASSIVLSDNGVSSGSAGIKSQGGNDGTLLLQTTTSGGAATTAVTVDNAQNVGVGVTPSAWSTSFRGFQVGGAGSVWSSASGFAGTYLGNNYYYSASGRTYLNTNTAVEIALASGGIQFSVAPSGTAGTAVSFTQAMTLDASGNLLVGTTSQINSGKVCIQGDLPSYNLLVLKATNSYVAGTFFEILSNSSGTAIGGIQQASQTTVSYLSSSDERLKIDQGIATSTNVVDQTIIHDFEWKADGKLDRGVFAQEAYAVKPSAVSVGKDDLTEDGNLAQPWSVDYSKYVPDIIVHAQQLKKQVQEQQALITNLTERLVALEGK